MNIHKNFEALRRWSNRSLANSFSLHAALIAISSSLVVALISLSVLYWSEKTALQERLRAKAERAAERIEGSINILESNVADLSRSPIFITALLDSRGRNTYVVPFLENYKFPIAAVSGLALCDINGVRLARIRSPLSECHADSPLFRRVIAGEKTLRELTPLRNGHLAWTVYHGVVFSYTGTIEGVVVTQLDLNDILHPIPHDLDLEGVALMRADNLENLVDVKAGGATRLSFATARTPVFKEAAATPFPIELVVKDHLSPFEHNLIAFLFSYGFGSLLLVLAVIYWSRRLAQYLVAPLARLTAIARQITESGNQNISMPTLKTGEVGDLANAFEKMLEVLQTSEATLENKVMQRTKELQSSEEALRASEHRLREIINAMPVPNALNDRQGNITFLNPSFIRTFGYTSEDIPTLEEWWLKAYPESKYREWVKTTWHAHLEKSSHEKAPFEPMELIVRCKDGMDRIVVINATLLGATFDRAYLVTLYDITDRKEYEEELKRSNTDLEQFSYAVSHDMRQPLRMISSYLQLLELNLADQLDGEKRDYFNYAIEGAKRIDRMLVELLEYSRVGRKGEPPTWVDSRALLDEALQFLQPAIAEAHAEVKISGKWPPIHASHDEILRLLQNLIDNAVKYRAAGQVPEITITSEVKNGEWRLCVADNGVGILPDHNHRLFQIFQRLHSRETYEGTGIGLALCRKIAEHHKGRIWVESEGEGRGSQFHVVLPVLRERQAFSEKYI